MIPGHEHGVSADRTSRNLTTEGEGGMTTTTKHTPGPWTEQTVAVMQFVGDDTHKEEIIQIGQEEGDAVAYVPFVADGHPQADADANARLIAAAPEMYDLLRELTDESEAHMIGTRLARVRALLAKIDGTD